MCPLVKPHLFACFSSNPREDKVERDERFAEAGIAVEDGDAAAGEAAEPEPGDGAGREAADGDGGHGVIRGMGLSLVLI